MGEVPSGGGGTDANDAANEASFQAMVAPLVVECTGCHSTIQPPNLTSFGALDAKYTAKPGSANILVTKGSLTAGVHQGLPYFTDPEQATVAAWIDGL